MRILLAIFAFAFLVATSTVSAQATRTWVSGVGDDVNPCSRTAPCKTFAGAISKTAVAGEINVLDPGGFGTVVVTKSLTIDGGGFIAGVLATGANGIIVNAPGGTVILRNLDMDGVGAGGVGTGLSAVSLVNAAALHIENMVVFNFGASNRSALALTAPTGITTEVSLRNVRVASCVSNGVQLPLSQPPPPFAIGGIGVGTTPATGSLNVTLDHVQVNGCSIGLLLFDGSNVVAHDSDFSHNGDTGVVLLPAAVAATLMLDSSRITMNGTGISADSSNSTVRLSDSTVLQNTTGLQATNSAAIISFNNNRLKGNTTDGAPTLNIYQH